MSQLAGGVPPGGNPYSTMSMGGASPYGLSGGLPFGAAGAPNPFAGYGTYGYPAQAGGAYQSAYNNALMMNAANYNNIMAGYGTLQNAVGGSYADLVSQTLAGGASIGGAYNALSGQVQGQIQGVQQSQLQANQAAYAAQGGQATQGLTAAGLGNTTVGSSVQAGLLQQKQLADTATNNQFAQLEAGYLSQLGSAGIQAYQTANQAAAGYQAQGIGAQTGIGLSQLGFEAGIQIPYPNLSQYGSLIPSSQQYAYGMSHPSSGVGGVGGGASSGMQNSGPYAPGGGGSGGGLNSFLPFDTGNTATGGGNYLGPQSVNYYGGYGGYGGGTGYANYDPFGMSGAGSVVGGAGAYGGYGGGGSEQVAGYVGYGY